MDPKHFLSRRDFLRLSAFTAGATLIVACGPQTAQPGAPTPGATTAADAPAAPTVAEGTTSTAPETQATSAPLAATGAYQEAPMLAQLVKDGKLPPVAERLPKNPYVVPHAWVQPGKYGGTLQTAASGTWAVGGFVHESMYGHSPIRYLKDGLEIGPGLAESWESNDDASEWTFHFREGLKWSDGEPFTVDDILYWWEDMVLNEEHPEGPPDETRSGKGTLATFTKVDDLTLQIAFDAPAPLMADLLATWVKRGIGAQWVVPKHYAQQFHKKYNDSVGEDWTDVHAAKIDFARSPDCPVMTGWRLVAQEEGVRGQWERNPYYWCVDTEGNQLPYIDRWNVTGYQDAEVLKLAIMEGKVDYDHLNNLPLSDVQALKAAQPRSKLEVRFWDSGSGTGSIMFFNYDYHDEKMRTLIRAPEWRKALSHAYNRAEVQKGVYFNTGELTTGTYSPKSIEYSINDEGKQVYAAWRDSASTYDPELAKQLLDGLGVVDKDGDGLREMPDGAKLTVRVDFHADAGKETTSKNQLMARDWQAIGLDAKLNPVPPASWDEQWRSGQLLMHTNWEASDGPNHLVNATWLVPIEPSRWAPLEGAFYSVRGTPLEAQEEDVNPWERKPPRLAAEAGGPIEQLWKLYDQSKLETDPMKRHQLVWDMVKVHVEDGPFFMGVVANYPRVILVKEDLKNVPQREELALGGYVNTWIHPTPAVYDPESWYFEDPEAHAG